MASLDALVSETVPAGIRLSRPLSLPLPLSEEQALAELGRRPRRTAWLRSFIGMGYHDCHTPAVILRNVLENPGWYTQYTPYQAEIAQGRLEALLNYQTMVADLTGLPLANASLLDEATAAGEAMTLCRAVARPGKDGFFVAEDCHPQTIAVVRTKAEPLGIHVHVGPVEKIDFAGQKLFGVLVQYPATDGVVRDFSGFAERAHAAGALLVMATDLLALTLLRSPGELGADVALGSAQRFGVPMGYGGPHAAFFATKEEHKRHLPGRIVGVSKDAEGRPAFRLSLQTREQHIRRDKATSNICTAQVLLAIMAAMYAVYHGPDGLREIARRVHALARVLQLGLRRLGLDAGTAPFFDTLRVRTSPEKGAGDRGAGPGEGDQPPLVRRRLGRGRPRRDHPARGAPRPARGFRGRAGRLHARAAGRRGRGGGPRPPRAEGPVPAPPGLQPVPRRARDAALPEPAAGARPLARALDDPARLLHDEAQRDLRDDPGDLARARQAPPVRAGRPGPRLPRDVRRPRAVAGRDHRVRRGVAPAQLRRAGRVRGAAHDPRVSPAAAARPTATCASSRSPPTARTPRARSWPASGWWRWPATPTGTSTSRTCGRRPRRTRPPSARSWSPTPRPTASSRRRSARSAASSTRAADRSTWTART